jgi:hypothetical protein
MEQPKTPVRKRVIEQVARDADTDNTPHPYYGSPSLRIQM